MNQSKQVESLFCNKIYQERYFLYSGQMSTISFDELVPSATVRIAIVNGIQYLSIRDFIMIVCDQNQDRAGKTWRNLSEQRKTELRQKVTNFNFKGRGQQDQPVITFDGALKLMQWLPGENAKNWRSKAAEILRRYFAGDKTLLKEIEANAASDAPVNRAARASLRSEKQQQRELSDSIDDIDQRIVKHRKLNVEFKEQNEYLEKHIVLRSQYCDVKEREYDMEIHFETTKIKLDQEKLNLERSKLDVEQKKIELHNKKIVVLRNELDYKRALKAFESEPTPSAPNPSIPLAIPDGPEAETTTVLKVYEANKGSFNLLRSDQRRNFLQKAGSLASMLYSKEFGKYPFKGNEGSSEVNTYPLQAQSLLSGALRKTYRDMTAGVSQTTIGDAFLRSANVGM